MSPFVATDYRFVELWHYYMTKIWLPDPAPIEFTSVEKNVLSALSLYRIASQVQDEKIKAQISGATNSLLQVQGNAVPAGATR